MSNLFLDHINLLVSVFAFQLLFMQGLIVIELQDFYNVLLYPYYHQSSNHIANCQPIWPTPPDLMVQSFVQLSYHILVFIVIQQALHLF